MAADDSSGDAEGMNSDDTRGKLSEGCSTKLPLLAEVMKSEKMRLLATVPVMTSLLPKLMTSDRTRLLSTVPVMTSLLAEVMRSDMTTLVSTVHVMTSLLGGNDDTGDERSTDGIVPGLGGKLTETSVADISPPLLAALVTVG